MGRKSTSDNSNQHKFTRCENVHFKEPRGYRFLRTRHMVYWSVRHSASACLCVKSFVQCQQSCTGSSTRGVRDFFLIRDLRPWHAILGLNNLKEVRTISCPQFKVKFPAQCAFSVNNFYKGQDFFVVWDPLDLNFPMVILQLVFGSLQRTTWESEAISKKPWHATVN